MRIKEVSDMIDREYVLGALREARFSYKDFRKNGFGWELLHYERLTIFLLNRLYNNMIEK